ncbi:MAG: hypothetical protein EBT55_04535 [Proteobacteria bacterium]|nr:hypothetical protein [Pseudomonadota bacterium]
MFEKYKQLSDQQKIIKLLFFVFISKFILIACYDFYWISEARYATIAMRMALNNNYLMPFFSPDEPFFGKPPLAFWVSAVSFELFNFSEFAGRLPHFLALILTLIFVFVATNKIYNQEVAIFSVLTISATLICYVLPSVMTESFLLLGMTMISCSFWLQINSDKIKNFYGYCFFIGSAIAMLTKGFVGIAFPGFAIFIYLLISKRWREFFQKFPIIVGATIFIGLSLPWFILAEKGYPGFLEYFILGENFQRFINPGWQGDRYGHAHKVFFGAIWAFLIITTLPVWPVVARHLGFAKNFLKKEYNFLLISFLVPMFILTFMRNMIGTYVIYALVPFCIMISIIIAEKKLIKSALKLTYFTLAIHLILIFAFYIKPDFLIKKINHEMFLAKPISIIAREQNYRVYLLLNNTKKIFGLYWFTKDKIKTIQAEDILSISSQSDLALKFLIIDSGNYEKLNLNQQKVLNKIECVTEKDKCLYEIISI